MSINPPAQEYLWSNVFAQLGSRLPVIESLKIGGSKILDSAGLLSLAKLCGKSIRCLEFHEVNQDVNTSNLTRAIEYLPLLEEFWYVLYTFQVIVKVIKHFI